MIYRTKSSHPELKATDPFFSTIVIGSVMSSILVIGILALILAMFA